MTKKDFETINAAIERLMRSIPDNKNLSQNEKICVFGAFAGFQLWFQNEYKDNIEK